MGQRGVEQKGVDAGRGSALTAGGADRIPAWVDGRLQPVGKLDAHLRGLRHKAISIFVLRGDQMLLQQRALSKYHTPGLWTNACCTHPHWRENATRCATRRLEEELGVVDLPLEPRGKIEYRADVGGGLIEHEVVDVFLAAAPKTIVLRPDPDEVMATRWVSRAALQSEIDASPERFTPWFKIYLSQHAQQIFGDEAAA
ncbi:MAG: isopentenyl-diphosphate Delta-isomerase [Pseudomonadota bacterium]